jgi:hypothetical protein
MKLYNDQLNAHVFKFILFICLLLPYMFRTGAEGANTTMVKVWSFHCEKDWKILEREAKNLVRME